MSSYRVTISPGAMLRSVPPERVLPMLADGVREVTTVEASDIMLVRGTPRLVIRYMAEGDAAARQVADHAVDVAASLVAVLGHGITRRDGQRWTPIA